jgi:hypothetical protein
VAADIFEGYDIPNHTWHASSADQRSKSDHLRTLLSAPPGAPNAKSSPLSRILFPGKTYNISMLFMVDYLPKVSTFPCMQFMMIAYDIYRFCA